MAGLVSLVAPEARLLPVTVLRPDGTGLPVDIADGIDYAVDQGVHVIVLALGTIEVSFAMRVAIDEALANGVTVIAAAGNTLPSPSEPSILFPASYTGIFGSNVGVFAVGASNSFDEIAVFSNYHENVDSYAPGTSLLMTNGEPDPHNSVIGPLPGGTYAAANGTSFSTGLVAGLAALVRAQERSWPDVEIPLTGIAPECQARMTTSSTFITMPEVPANPIPDKPRVSCPLACQYGPGLTVPGDINGDNLVNGIDLSLLLGDWGPLPNNGSLHGANLAGGDLIDGGDLSLILGNWTSSGM